MAAHLAGREGGEGGRAERVSEREWGERVGRVGERKWLGRRDGEGE